MQRTPTVDFGAIPGEIPNTVLPIDVQLPQAAEEAIRLLNDWSTDSLTEGAIWRDLLALTGTYRTIHGRVNVHRMLNDLSSARKRSVFELGSAGPRIVSSLEDASWIDVDVNFRLRWSRGRRNCSGIVSVVYDSDGEWRIWMLRSWLESFEGRGHPDVLAPLPASHTVAVTEEQIYDVVIVGGGLSGLSLAGRLHALGLTYLLLERTPNIGDVWKGRYDSLTWHTIKEFGELPFGHTFEDEDPVLLPSKQVAARHKAWAENFGINVNCGCHVEAADWDEGLSIWKVRSSTGTYRSRNLVLAIGPCASKPARPLWATPEQVYSSGFKGSIVHSVDYQNCKAWAGKKGIVVGTANTGHDVAEDMLRARMTTTMIQRSKTFVMPAEWVQSSQKVLYNKQIPTARADRLSYTAPYSIFRELANRIVHKMITENPKRFDALEKAGFKLERYGNVANHVLVRLGGHYIDTGASAKIAAGLIRIETRAVSKLTCNGLVLDDGTELNTDVIVLATGFEHDFREQAREIIGDVADQMDDYWGLDAEGELRGYAKRAGHAHLFYHGGDVRLGRFFSRFIALQIQANLLAPQLLE
ncbi:FAD/NAD(P)-binding domain-containing protein [Plenodomus tracheiphilus IPT5]|uniref:FAD/NAD(P)-binding domain-containing protein n=1 Tax=Plenodomus tracheiphilus IPT5 TaxID=1408161 RepID=A0A6A7B779_9PLEO|nr:FAD/NAD(P)-binding domain-containing protein [Plenodomus tracheiphilus IPT5]